MRLRLTLSLLILPLLLALSACATGTGTGAITGTLRFEQNVPPPTDKLITVEIYHFTTPEEASTLVSRAYVPSTGSRALPFAIGYDRTQVVPKDIYIVQAYIEEPGGKVTWKTTMWNLILTQGRPKEDIELRLNPN